MLSLVYNYTYRHLSLDIVATGVVCLSELKEKYNDCMSSLKAKANADKSRVLRAVIAIIPKSVSDSWTMNAQSNDARFNLTILPATPNTVVSLSASVDCAIPANANVTIQSLKMANVKYKSVSGRASVTLVGVSGKLHDIHRVQISLAVRFNDSWHLNFSQQARLEWHNSVKL
jgi:hypothetical protein